MANRGELGFIRNDIREGTQVGKLAHYMEPADTIREAVSAVGVLRSKTTESPQLLDAVRAIKQIQAERFRTTYSDLLASSKYGAAATFFLEELYSDKDFAQRDAQFARIAGALQTLFPKQVVHTAVSLAKLHHLTEALDQEMAEASLKLRVKSDPRPLASYVTAWNFVGRKSDRTTQLDTVLAVGHELDRLTRTPGLRLMLKMMRRPAQAAGLGALQSFLETGFDTFAALSRDPGLVTSFLGTIEEREKKFIELMFSQNININ